MTDDAAINKRSRLIKEQYENKRVMKPISFNIYKDKELLDHANTIKDFSNWVKDKIREDMEKAKVKTKASKAKEEANTENTSEA
ncbi:hypothetical protein NI470_05910 [Acinetobacter lwoffii]|uniref:hypothetical protein n=1 Tax=Acinetobacter lwoffii TaxID=28090 RepID=UPI00209AA3B6|nr:hypothetical protein [Acinetobacter lwoffii]MCO8073044.1 hypothetical protein [Acinetobacter lwoffii]MCO8076142.1 hypothetical protein [Acinetobacter lwoffii]